MSYVIFPCCKGDKLCFDVTSNAFMAMHYDYRIESISDSDCVEWFESSDVQKHIKAIDDGEVEYC